MAGFIAFLRFGGVLRSLYLDMEFNVPSMMFSIDMSTLPAI